MLKSTRALAWSMVALTSLGVISFTGCGGGGGGGGGEDLPDFLALSQTLFFGIRQAGGDQLSPFPNLPTTFNQAGPNTGMPPGAAAAAYSVVGANFTPGAGSRQDYLQLTFNNLLQASSITSNPPSGNDGIVVLRRVEVSPGVFTSQPVGFTLDPAGVVDPSNAFPSPGVAPATVRLYLNTDNDLTTPEGLAPGTYTLTINNSLRSFNNGPFCVAGLGANCVNSYLPVIPFAIGGDTTGLAVSQTAPSVPNQNDPSTPLNSEIVLNFNKPIDFPTLVGTTSTLDPFISLPRGVAYVVDCNDPNPVSVPLIPPFAAIGNLYLNYNPPINPATGAAEPPPPNLGYVVYMPDPFLNPTQVRVRFCDISTLVGTNNPGANVFQNYASNPAKLPIASQDPARNGALLQLPSILPVAGSLPGYSPALGAADQRAAILDVVVLSATPQFPTPPFPALPPVANPVVCYAAVGNGLQDRYGNQFAATSLTSDFWLRFIWAEGPALARNPMPPDVCFVGSQQGQTRGLAAINTGGSTTPGAAGNTQVPVWAGGTPNGTISLEPNRLSNASVLGTPLDIEVGAWILSQTQPGQGTNGIYNPGRGSATRPGVPDSQNGTTPTGLVALVLQPFPAPAQPWGNFVYVVDGDQNAVKVINGYNFQLITTLTGVASPGGLGISPNLEFLYVSNQQQGTVTRYFANPASPNFHTAAGTVNVGAGPRGISVQPANEDVFVLNFAANTFSIIDVSTQAVRATFQDSGAVGPTDCFVTQRMLGQGLTNAYTAFITNFFSDDVSIYESDSFSVPENSLQGVVKANRGGFLGPARGSWNWQSYIGFNAELGAFIANSRGSTVDELTLQNFTLSPAPNFPGPAGIRTYRIYKSFNGSSVPGVGTSSPTDASIDNMSGLYNLGAAGLSNAKNLIDPATGAGVPSEVLVSYPGAGIVAVFAYGSGGTVLGSASVPGCDFLQAYYDQ